MNGLSLKVYIVTPFESKLTKRGTRHPTLANVFVEKRYKVEYITSNFNHSEKNHFAELYIQKISKRLPYNLKVFSVLGYKKSISIARIISHIQFVFKSYLYLKRVVKSGDIVLIPSRPPELIWICSILKRKKQIKLILDVRDILPDGFPIKKGIRRKAFEIYCNIFQKKSLSAFDKSIFTSMNFKNWLNRYTLNMDSVFIPLGFDEKRWRNMKPCYPHDIKNKINIVYIGNLTSNIDIHPIIEAIKNKSNFHFTIIGGGDDLQKIKNYIQDREIKNVRFTGIIDPGYVPRYMTDQHLSVIPMHLNTLPNKFFDSIAAYLPVLVIGENDTSKIVRQQNIGWVLPFNEIAIGEFFDRLTKDEIIEKSNNIGKIRNKFSKENLYQEFVKYVIC